MSIAAVPQYLANAAEGFQHAPPGHRFSLYLEAWKSDSDFTLDKNNKTQAIKKVLPVPQDSVAALDALRARQLILANALGAEIFDALATAPFATGLGMEHPFENGFAFLNPYGLPYFPGSGVKGVLREVARQLVAGNFGKTAGWKPEHVSALFGADTGDLTRGALTFWDVIPTLPGNKMRVDIMTPHQSHYYQHGQSPHDSGQPTPIPFLTVPPGAQFCFIVSCEEKYLGDSSLKGERWKVLLRAAFEHAFDWLGFGAKTAVGYGVMAEDAKGRQARLETIEAERAAAAKQVAAANRQAELAQMPAFERSVAEAMETPQFKGQTKRAVLFQLLKQNKIAGDSRSAAAEALKALMRAENRWKEGTTKKDPAKDHDYQDTVTVKNWLSGK